DVLVSKRASPRGDHAFLVQDRGDLPVHQTLAIELRDAAPKAFEIGVVVVVAVNPPSQSMFAHGACLPDDLDRRLATCSLLIEQHLLDDEAQDAAALLR